MLLLLSKRQFEEKVILLTYHDEAGKYQFALVILTFLCSTSHVVALHSWIEHTPRRTQYCLTVVAQLVSL